MRLYLSSDRIGDRAGALLGLVGFGARAAIVSNALDGVSAAAREIYRNEVYDPFAQFASLGIVAEELDPRAYFGRPDDLAADLARYELVWVMGGNVFTLRRAMKQSGFDAVITQMLDRDAIVYGGFSAGAVVAGPSLEGFEHLDDPGVQPRGYAPELVLSGLDLIDFSIVPHDRSAHPEARAAERITRYLAGRGRPFRALRDGEVVVWTGPRAGAAAELKRIA
jgi:dipeptidase E